VPEPPKEEVRAIAAAGAARLADAASLVIEAEAIDAAVELTGASSPTGASGKGHPAARGAVREREGSVARIDRDALTAAFARRSGLPLVLLSDALPLRIADVREHFETRVLGQPQATSTLVDLIAVLKAGLNDPKKPLASFFFVGPTGVGKTESARRSPSSCSAVRSASFASTWASTPPTTRCGG
jgi:ATP-dependent Clp protease ATP-binding subunit ClpC